MPSPTALAVLNYCLAIFEEQLVEKYMLFVASESALSPAPGFEARAIMVLTLPGVSPQVLYTVSKLSRLRGWQAS